MEQYISKSALIAEINKLKNISLEYGYTTEQRIVADVGKDLILKGLLDYIDALEVSNDTFIEKATEFFEENIKEEDCKFGSSEWTELRAEYESLDSFIRAFINYMKGE